jgi:hypothetical protein
MRAIWYTRMTPLLSCVASHNQGINRFAAWHDCALACYRRAGDNPSEKLAWQAFYNAVKGLPQRFAGNQ